MRFEDLNWMDVEEYLKDDDRLILVLGACEQHAYLSLTTDVKIPLALADAASERTGVPVAPPLAFGVSPYFADYPGTISLRLQTFLQVVDDIVRWLYRQGFRRLLVLNGHGGNAPAQSLLHELVNDLPELRAAWCAWWQSPSVLGVAEKHGLSPTHASWVEAFAFTRVGRLPESTKESVETAAILDAASLRRRYGDGMFGGPYQTGPEVMEAVFNAAVADVVAALEALGQPAESG
jgi:creatinine amidohydrolase